MRGPLTGNLVGMGAYIVGQDAVTGQNLADHVDNVVRGETVNRRAQGRLKSGAMGRDSAFLPVIGDAVRQNQRGEGGIEIACHLGLQLDGRRDINLLDIDLQQRRVADPRFVLDFDGIVAEPDDQIGPTQNLPLDLPHCALDAPDRKRMILIYQPLGHRRARKRNAVTLDKTTQQTDIAHPHRIGAEYGDRALCRRQEFERRLNFGISGSLDRDRRDEIRDCLSRHRNRNVFRQIEMNRPHGFGQRQPHRLCDGFCYRAFAQHPARLGNRREQLLVVDIHLDTPAELVGIQVAGNGNHRRPVEPGIPDSGGEVRRPRPKCRNPESGRAGHTSHHVSRKSGRAFMRRQDERQVVFAHCIHQRQHVAAWNAEAMGYPGPFEYLNDQFRVIHFHPR